MLWLRTIVLLHNLLLGEASRYLDMKNMILTWSEKVRLYRWLNHHVQTCLSTPYFIASFAHAKMFSLIAFSIFGETKRLSDEMKREKFTSAQVIEPRRPSRRHYNRFIGRVFHYFYFCFSVTRRNRIARTDRDIITCLFTRFICHRAAEGLEFENKTHHKCALLRALICRDFLSLTHKRTFHAKFNGFPPTIPH